MNLEPTKWADYKISDIFIVRYGVNLELNACEEVSADSPDSVNFVARTSQNNGVTARVKIIPGVTPQKAGLISVAGGGSVLSTFLQKEPFYSGRDLYTLEAKSNISDEAKLFIITIIEKNKYKYSYGRQANKTLPDLLIKLPSRSNGMPDYAFMEMYIKSLHHKPLTTKIRNHSATKLDVADWKFFYLKHICKISMGNKLDYAVMTTDYPAVNFVGRSAENEGVMGKVDLIADIKPYKAGAISVALGGSLGASYVQTEDFYTSQNVSVLEFDDNVSIYAKLFITTCIMFESRYKYFPFGRELNTHIKTDFGFILPIKRDINGDPVIDETYAYSAEGYIPDWEYMEQYMKSLPYGDRIE